MQHYLLADSPAAHTSFSDSASEIDLLIPSGASRSDADLFIGSGEGGGVTGKDESAGCSGGSIDSCSVGAPSEGGLKIPPEVNSVSSAKSLSPSSVVLQPASLWLSSRISNSKTWISSPKLSCLVCSAATNSHSTEKVTGMLWLYYMTTNVWKNK